MDLFYGVGIAGLFLIVLGVLSRKRNAQDLYYIVGGLCLVVYSIYIKDMIFIFLQVIFILAAVYDEERILLLKRKN